MSPNKSITHLLIAWPAAVLIGVLREISLLPVVCFNKNHKDLQMT